MSRNNLYLITLLISVALNIYFISVYFYTRTNEVKVKFDACNTKTLEIFTVQDGKVFKKALFVDSEKVGNLVAYEVEQLEDCTVIDSKNWQCGGKDTYSYGISYHSARYLLINNKFEFYESWSSPSIYKSCDVKYKQIN